MLKRLPLVLLVLPFAVVGVQTSGEDEAAPTFTKDVAPILFENCVSCHRPGQIAPMTLQSYQEARPWARAIANAVATREMPPWGADSDHSLYFKTDPTLTQEEIDTVVAWAEAGAPKGNDADMPALPEFPADARWTNGQPDYIFEPPVEFVIPAEGELDVFNVYSKVPFEEDVFAEVIEMKPSAAGVMHHSGAYIVHLPEDVQIMDGLIVDAGTVDEDEDEDDVRSEQQVFSLAGTSKLISYVPGRGMERHHPGTAKRIPAGAYIRWNMHYTTQGEEVIDRPQLGIWFNTKPVTHEVLNRSNSGLETYIVEGKEIEPVYREDGSWRRGPIPNIPPYAERWKITQIQSIPESITLYGMSPHMHLRGKDMKYTLTYPDGRDHVILDVPAYSFEWQFYYELEEPLAIPAGSKLTATAHYDNSLNNAYNPAPHLEVYWAEQSWDEMFSPQVRITVDSQDLTKGTEEDEEDE